MRKIALASLLYIMSRPKIGLLDLIIGVSKYLILEGVSILLSQKAPSRPSISPNLKTLQLILKPEGASGGNALCFTPAAMLGYRLDLTPGEDMDLEGKGAPGSDSTYYAIYDAETAMDYAILDPPERTRALTPLHRAINESQAILVPLFLHLGSDINETDSDGRPLLHKATRHAGWAPRLCKDLVSAGASLNTLDEQGRTPLHHAVVLGLYETAEYYLENGADVMLKITVVLLVSTCSAMRAASSWMMQVR